MSHGAQPLTGSGMPDYELAAFHGLCRQTGLAGCLQLTPDSPHPGRSRGGGDPDSAGVHERLVSLVVLPDDESEPIGNQMWCYPPYFEGQPTGFAIRRIAPFLRQERS